MSIKSQVLKLLSGNVVAQLIPLVFLPLLARLYTPEDFGHFAFFVALSSMLSLVACGRYEVALISAPCPRQKQHLFNLAFYCALGFSLVLAAVLQLLALLIAIPALVQWCLPLSVFSVALFNLLSYFHNDQQNYRRLTLMLVFRAASWVALCVVLKQSAQGLSYAFLLSYAAVALFHLKLFRHKLHSPWQQALRLGAVAKRYRHFLWFNSPHAILTSFNLNVPALSMTYFQFTAALGAYSQANKVMVTPWQVIASALYRVFYKTCAQRQQQKQRILPLIGRFLGLYALAIAPIFIAAHYLSETLFVWFLGPDWELAGSVAVALLPWIYFRAIGGFMAFVPLLLSWQKWALYYELLYTLALASSLIYGLSHLSVLEALQLFALVGAGFVAIQVAWFLYGAAQHDRSIGC